MSSPFFFRQKRILATVLTVAAVVFSPAPIVAQRISPLLDLYKAPKRGGFLLEEEIANLARALGKWTRDHVVSPPSSSAIPRPFGDRPVPFLADPTPPLPFESDFDPVPRNGDRGALLSGPRANLSPQPLVPPHRDIWLRSLNGDGLRSLNGDGLRSLNGDGRF